jgi:hypothetical protein
MKWTINKIRKEIIADPHRFKCVVAGRRWGKTHLSMLWLLHQPLQAGERRWVILPTYRQAKLVALPILKDIFTQFPQAKINETELSVKLANGSIVELKGADNEDSLRGVSLGQDGSNAVVLDEFAFMKPNVWEEIILPMLATTEGRALFIGTPNGFGKFHDLYVKGLGGDQSWKSWQFKTVDGGFVSQDEINLAKSTMDERVYRQEFLATFETVSNRAVYNFNRDTHVRDADISTKRFAGLDFNISKFCCQIFCEYTNGDIHVYDEIILTDSNTVEMAKEIRKRHPDIQIIYPDPASNARSTNSRRSDAQILRDFNFTLYAHNANPSQIDRLNALNAKLKSADGHVGMTVSPKCVDLIRDLEQLQRDAQGGMNKKADITLSHSTDAIMYPVHYRYNIINTEMKLIDRVW